jgi:hypothetical protein
MSKLARMYSILLAAWLLMPVTCRSQQADIIQHARALPLRLQSSEIQYTSTASGPSKRTVVVDGRKFFVNLGGQAEWSLGFDGTKYWSRRGTDRSSVTGRSKVTRQPQGDMHPLIAPYIWFWDGLDNAIWSDLHVKEKWDEVIGRMKYRDAETIRDHPCDVYEVDYPASKTLYTVALAKDLDGFPIRVIKTQNGPSYLNLSLDVTEVRRHQSGAILCSQFSLNNVTCKVNTDQLKINERVNPAVFSLDISQVDWVKDVDTGVVDRIPKPKS